MVIGPVVDCMYHVHPELELTYVESSYGVRFIGDNISDFRENDLVLTGSMLPHHYMNLGKDSQGDTWSQLKVIKFSSDFAGPQLFEIPEFSAVKKMFDAAVVGLHFSENLAKTVHPLLCLSFTAKGAARVLHFLELLSILADAPYTPLGTRASHAIQRSPDERMKRVLDYIHQSLEQKLEVSCAQAASIAHLTPQAFSRYFGQSTRKTFSDYVTELKIGRACTLLANTDSSILEISLESGFRNLSNFNRRFLQLKKQSPRAFRAKIKPGIE